MWSREDDIRHDCYRPAGFHKLKAGLDKQGKLIALSDHFISFGDNNSFANDACSLHPNIFPAEFVPNLAYGASFISLKTPTGALRAPRDNGLAFVFQSFLDEVAHAAERDPLEFHLDLLSGRRAEMLPPPPSLTPGMPLEVFDPQRMTAVVRKVAEKAGWGERTLPKNTGLGLAYHWSHFGYVAEVAEVSIATEKAKENLLPGDIKIKQVWVAVDIGSHIVNPSGAENQVQGAVLDGIGQFLGQQIRLVDSAVVESNFNNFPLLRMNQAPPVEVHFLLSDNSPTGLGEPALPPSLPAVANAIFAASGVRIRHLPLGRQSSLGKG